MQYDTPTHNSWKEMCEALEGYFNHHAVEEMRKWELYTERIRSWGNLPGESVEDYVPFWGNGG